ncbi:MAG: tail fiber domain-containing protein [Candidatus Kapabacteria bacterium]|nr:tail fiber domain-containing protein [Candidatus Kapabacteria bacterium]
MRNLILFFILSTIILQVNHLTAQVPNTLSWQGILQESNGDNLDGQYNITMRLFDVSSGGTAQWTESQNNVQISDGLANLTLGEITPLNISFDTQLWLEIQVGDGTPLPRIKLTSVPYALSALSSIEYDPTWSGSNDTTGNIYRHGNVGIGTEIPTEKLSVVGNSYFTGKIAIGYEGLPPNPFFFDVLSGASKRFTIFNFGGGLVGSFQNDGSKDGAVVRYRGLTDETKFWDVGQTDLNSFSINGRNNATLNILDNGNVGIGTDSPTALLHTNGLGTNAGNVLFTGKFKSSNPADPPASSSGTRMMWYPDKAAFRAGEVENSEWNKSNIGNHSTAFGLNNTASGIASFASGSGSLALGNLSFAFGLSSIASEDNSIAMGNNSSATGTYSTSIGYYTEASGYAATALGESSIASGSISTAMGFNSEATGSVSTAMGNSTEASGDYSTSMGDFTTASGYISTAMGYNTDAEGDYSTAMGWLSKAAGDVSIAMGFNTKATGNNSTAFGSNTTSSGLFSTAMGVENVASGRFSLVMGQGNKAKSSYETVVGAWSTDYTPNDTMFWNADDRLFVVGNGSGPNDRSNAITILKNGNIGFGTDLPTALLHTSGSGTGEGNVLFTGEFKSSNPGAPPDSGAGTRMMWYPDKGAFRAGAVSGTQWDKDNIGSFSVAMGVNNIASGYNSLAYGQSTTASDTLTTAIGFLTNATKDFATAIGYGTTASGTASLSAGILSTASGEYAAAIGYNNNASGIVSVALGNETVASNTYSTALGYFTIASGYNSTSLGSNTEAKSGFETVIGRWNTDYTPIETNGWNNSDRLFVVGNGTASDSRSNAVTVLKNGNTGIGTDSPTALLHTNGIGTNAGNILFAGEYVSPNPADPPASGSGSRMMWYPNKGAFRAGFANGSQWDKDNIGYFSVAMGASTTASALNSTALGRNTTASGQFSTAMGNETNASGTTSTALGSNTIASGDNSSSFGAFTTASGSSSAAFGDNTSAKAFCETVFGRWNADYTPGGGGGWNTTDRLFVIGNGTASNTRSNAMTVIQNGRIGLQTVTSPTYALELPNSTTNGIGRGRANLWATYSDGRLKTNRTEITYGLNEILQLEPLKYFHHNSITENGVINISNEGANDIGFIAQDLFKILPEIVSPPENEASDLWSVSYSKLTPVLVKAIQEQQSIIDNQNQRIEELERKLEILLNKIGN